MKNLSNILKNHPNLVRKSARKNKRKVSKKKGQKQGGFLGVLASAIALHLIKAGVNGIAGSISRRKKGKGVISNFIKNKAIKYAAKIKQFAQNAAIDVAIGGLKRLKGGKGMSIHGRGGKGMTIHGRGMKLHGGYGVKARAPSRAFKVTVLKHGGVVSSKCFKFWSIFNSFIFNKITHNSISLFVLSSD